jgi:hypothetical protein
MDVSGSGRGCNTLTGRFEILELVRTPSGGIERCAVDFEQHCEGGVAALHGALRYRSAVPLPATADEDADGYTDEADNCPTVANPTQADSDFDGRGDACDPFPSDPDDLAACLVGRMPSDDDGDGVSNAIDRCPSSPIGGSVDATGCTLEQFCAAVDATAARGAKICRHLDWGNDEPLMKRGGADCRVVGRRSSALCVPAPPS